MNKNQNKIRLWNNSETIQLLNKSLQNSKISIVSTDTILGFLGQINQESYNEILKLKNIPNLIRPFLILISSKEKLKNFIDLSTLTPNLSKVIDKCWPGPITLIFKAKKDLPDFAKSKTNTIALRCPDHKELICLLKNFNGLFSTSANKATNTPPSTIYQIDQDLLDNTDLLVYEENQDNQSIASTIIDCSSPEKIKLIRNGAFPLGELEKYYGDKIEK